ncbi:MULTISPECIES: PilN domain-containing protein [unclassified Neisseria]|uniref:PilN domain-containing protein n=1 Tax=unclassified Neisseria TaxID=2623750 RepID=UPI0026663B8C|nr:MULTISPECIES: PilN domain-containing protein [unclassified Neisseria]MDO1509911.1 PilN domain-containing protein [Neisseria sp. MVDL19-042950]MDO1516110.1 PilN domain-containing protein [Neisseria sp. MVDL18-041461]MDO1563225.1 PilN domain-containing protein [Neisseria sp. MVDL20-010259]
MIELTRINLLPYREKIQQKKKQQFKALMLFALFTGLGFSALTYLSINNAIGGQEKRNEFLNQEIAKIDQNLLEINKLKKEKEDFLARKQKVEELQEKRFQAAYLIDSINVLIPEGTYITSINAENPSTYTISGKATSDNKIAMFMRSLPSTGLFTQPELLSIKKVDNSQEFTLKVLLNQASRALPVETSDINAAVNKQGN